MNAPESPWVVGSQDQSTPPASVFRPTRPTNADQVLTLENAERGVTLRVGDHFSLDLNQAVWNVRLRDEKILSTDGQGNFQALQGGKTKVYATSDSTQPDPGKNDSGPPGARARVFVEIPVTVLCT